MIGIQGKYLCSFNLNDKLDFIREEDLSKFIIIEECGNILPYFQLVFKSPDRELPNYLNEGIILKAKFGKDSDSLDDLQLVIHSMMAYRTGDDYIVYNITGLYYKIDYLDTRIFITDKINGATALKQIGSKFFNVDSNLSETADSMYWKQYNISHKKFINDIWLYTYIPESFISIGIDIKGNMKIRDIKKLLSKSTTDWDLGNNRDVKNHIDYDGDYVITSQAGFINAWLGAGRNKFLYDLDAGNGLIQNEDVKPLMALTRKLLINANREKKAFENGIINENVHENYWRAYLRNIISLAIFSTVKLTWSFNNDYRDIHVLDTILFKESAPTGNKISSSEYSSGIYINTKVSRILSQKSMVTIVESCREGFNQPEGDLK